MNLESHWQSSWGALPVQPKSISVQLWFGTTWWRRPDPAEISLGIILSSMDGYDFQIKVVILGIFWLID